MVSYTRPPRSDSSNSSAPSSPKVVNFGDVSVSRQVTNEEHWSLYSFEFHASQCSSCADPYVRYKAGKKLCKEGDRLARDVTGVIYRRDGEAYSRTKEEGKKVRIELPGGYDRTRELLRAVEKGVRHKKPFITAQKQSTPEPEPRTPDVSPRGNRPSTGTIPSTSMPIKQPVREAQPLPEPFDWRPSNPVQQMRWYAEPTRNTSKRGSLYADDMARLLEREKLEGQLSYKIEVREPRPRHHTGHHRVHRPQSGLWF